MVEIQHKYADAGKSIGFREMGIFSYPIETDSKGELSKRLDGILAAFEFDDVLILQLPTENGLEFEQRLIQKARYYGNSKVIYIIHNMDTSEFVSEEIKQRYQKFYKEADNIVVTNWRDYYCLKEYGIENIAVEQELSQRALADAVVNAYDVERMSENSNKPINMNEIHVAFGIHDKTGNYCVWTGVTMQSILEHTTAKVCFHVLHDDTLNRENKKRLLQIASSKGSRVCFHRIQEDNFLNLEEQLKYYTIGSLFRILLPEVIEETTKILYMDSDLLVNCDIRELWEIDITKYCMAAVPDENVANGKITSYAVKKKEVPALRYFNSGVLYLNLEKIRQKGNMREQVLGYISKAKESNLPDQDALNALYNSETLLLDGHWNYFAQIVRTKKELNVIPAIYHYVGTHCNLSSLTEMDQLYYETICRTPWGAKEGLRQMKRSLNRAIDQMKQWDDMLKQTTEVRKKYIFYGTEKMAMKNLYQLVTIQQGDYRILSRPVTEEKCILPCENFSKLQQEKEEFIVFVLPEADDGESIKKLEQLGLEMGKNYFVISRLLPVELGGYLY